MNTQLNYRCVICRRAVPLDDVVKSATSTGQCICLTCKLREQR